MSDRDKTKEKLLDEVEQLRRQVMELEGALHERKRTEEKLQHSEATLRALLNASQETALLIDLDGLVIASNEVGARRLGKTDEELVGTNIYDIFPPEMAKSRRQYYSQIIETGRPVLFQDEYEGKSFEVSLYPVMSDGDDADIAVHARDITEYRKAEDALRRSEERFKLAMEASREGLWDWDVVSGDVYYSPGYVAMLGYSEGEIPKKVSFWKERIHPEDNEGALQANTDCIENRIDDFEIEFRMRAKNGDWRWMLGRGKAVLRNPDGQATRMVGTHTDITERKRAEESLRQSEEQLTFALSAANDGLWDWNIKTGEAYFSPRYYTMLGYVPDELPASYDTWRGLLHPDDLERVEQIVQEHTQHRKEGFSAEFRLRTKEEGWRWVLGRGKVFERDEEGNPIRMVGTHTDIGALKESEETFRALTEYSIDTIMRFDREHRHLYVNPIVEAQTGMKPEAFIGKTHQEMGFPEGLVALWEEAIDSVFESGEPERLEFELPNGLWIDWLLTPELSSVGDVSAVVGSARDITERKRADAERAKLEEQLRQAQKMEAIGRLAGGVAHDFNNILTGITGYTEMIQSSLGTGDPIYSDLEEVRKAAERASGLTSQLLTFSRKQIINPKVIMPNDILNDSQKMLRRIIGEDIDLVFTPGQEIWRVKADPAQLDQILVNLAVNARDAMHDGGKLTIETKNVTLDSEQCSSYQGAVPGDYVMLMVSDSGHGMDAETQEHIFEPFFSTKGRNEGTGLGLSTVFGIVKQNKGFINVFSEPGLGTRFEIYIPAVMDQPDEFSRKVAPKNPTGAETILLVEDEVMVRRLAKRVLEWHGYKVIEHHSGGQAVVYCEKHDHLIDLLLTDVIMPGMNGKELFSRLRVNRPELKALFMSGYAEDIIVHDGALEEGTKFLQKPFTIESLTRQVRDLLNH